METLLIFIIIGLASAYLLRKFYRSVQNKGETQCGCSCTSCPKDNDCDETSLKAIQPIKR